MDGMSELAIAYILQGVLKALDYIHHMGYVHRYFKKKKKKKAIHFPYVGSSQKYCPSLE